MSFKRTYTLTFGDQAENHVGMQKIGTLSDEGFSFEDLQQTAQRAYGEGLSCQLIDLSAGLENVPNAHLLIIRNGVSLFGVSADDAFSEQERIQYDTKAKMRGVVKNKRARHNVCFSDSSQEPDYEQGKGRVVAFDSLPILKKIKDALPTWLGPKARNRVAEGNLYYDVKKCGIGYHGDSERRRVVGVRLGHTLPLCFQWYYRWKRVGPLKRFDLRHGDVYVMSEKATGNDWKKSSVYTLRHAAGSESYVKVH